MISGTDDPSVCSHVQTIRAGITCRRLVGVLALGASVLVPAPALAQAEGDTAAAWGGGAFGAVTGVTLGLVGGVAPCSLTIQGTTCARVAAALGGVVASASGAVLAYHDPGALEDRLIGAGIGAALGAALGLGARAAVRQIEARDIATVAVAGGALGAVPLGAGVGLGAGLVLGSALWLALPDGDFPHALALAVVGMALGGLTEWAYSAIDASQATPVQAQLTVRF